MNTDLNMLFYLVLALDVVMAIVNAGAVLLAKWYVAENRGWSTGESPV